MRHKTALLHTGLFLCLFALVWGVTNTLVARAERDPAAEKYTQLFAGGQAPTTQLWGTSHVVHGVSPCLLAPGVHNFAFNASNPSFYRAWYAAWRRFNPPPARVVFGLDTFVYKRFAWNRRYEQDSGFWPWPEVLRGIARLDDDAATVALNRAPLIRHREALQDASVGLRHDKYRLLWDRACRGFVPLAPRQRPTGAPASAGPLTASETAKLPDDPAYVADLTLLLGSLARDGVRLIGFQPPYYRGVAPEDARINERIARLLAAHGAPFLNYNADGSAALNARLTHYADATHLDADGAALFSHRLAADLRARGLL